MRNISEDTFVTYTRFQVSYARLRTCGHVPGSGDLRVFITSGILWCHAPGTSGSSYSITARGNNGRNGAKGAGDLTAPDAFIILQKKTSLGHLINSFVIRL